MARGRVMKKISILVAEDEPGFRLLYEAEFQDEGWRVVTAENGLQVLGYLEDESFDLLVTDIKMPDMHALEMLPRVREEHPALPVIVVTAYGGVEDDFTLKSCKIAAYFRKPVDFSALKAKIREILSEKQGV